MPSTMIAPKRTIRVDVSRAARSAPPAPIVAGPLEPHPLSLRMPAMTEDEYAALRANVELLGKFTDPAMRYQGKILDGNNRQRVSIDLGIPLPIEEFAGTEEEAEAYVLSKAVRRNLNDGQRACAAVKFLPYFEKVGKARQSAAGGQKSACGTSSTSAPKLVSGKTRAQMAARLNQTGDEELNRKLDLHAPMFSKSESRYRKVIAILDRMYGPDVPEPPPFKARDEAGKMFSISGRSVQDAKKLFDVDVELFEKVARGGEVLKRAVQFVKRKQQTLERENKLALVKKTGGGDFATFIRGDALEEMPKLTRRRFKLIFWDPPYNLGFPYDSDPNKDKLPEVRYLRMIERVIQESRELLTPDGSIFAMISEEHVAEFGMQFKNAGFHLRRLIVWNETFGEAGTKNFGRTCRYIWYFVMNKDKYVINETALLTHSKRHTKYGDKRQSLDGLKMLDALWEIPRLCGTFKERVPDEDVPTQLPVELCKRIIAGFTDPGDEVLDPMCGTGPIARACASLHRRFTGIDRSKKYIKIAERELAITEE